MTNRFVCNGTTQKTIRFKTQIEDYTKYACKGYYNSPEFGKDDCESKWSLLVHVYDGADHENFIDVRLQRHDYVTEEQYVSVRTSIVNCFGFNVLKNEKKILFGGSNDDRILAVAKEELKGLKKMFYLPKDTLTIQCDMLIHESNVSAYKQEERFLNDISPNENSFSEYFARSRLVKKAEDYFVRKITNFSVQSCGCRTTTAEFQSENLGGNWCLVVCNTTDYNDSLEYLDIRLIRREGCEQQLVKVNLSITDPLNNELLTKEKFAYFTSSREVQVLPSTEIVLSSWYGLRKKQLIPDDTLTLHCKMVLYEQIDDTLDSNVITSIYAPMHLILCFLAVCSTLSYIFYYLYLAILYLAILLLYFIWYIILVILKITVLFLIAVFAMVEIFKYIKRNAENIIHRKKAEEIKRESREKEERNMLENYHTCDTDSYVERNYPNRRQPQCITYSISGLDDNRNSNNSNQRELYDNGTWNYSNQNQLHNNRNWNYSNQRELFDNETWNYSNQNQLHNNRNWNYSPQRYLGH